MKFKQQTKPKEGVDNIVIIALINVLFLLIMFLFILTPFITPPVISIKLPKTITSDTIAQKNFIITISGENIIFLNSSVLTLNELESKLKHLAKNTPPVLIKADSRASMGRIVDVWDLCRKLGIERINIATNRSDL
jgi:biopolymer transport protein ExbD